MIKKYSALIISVFVFLSTTGIIIYSSLSRTDGIFFYTLDDPYIHMAMAKNFSLFGVWGVTRHEFTSCSSSPLWTLLLSGIYFFSGVKDITPFVLNILFSLLSAFISFLFVKKFTDSKLIQTIILIFILLFSPFVSVVFTGLEHSMYSFFMVLTIYFFYEIIKDSKENKSQRILFLISVTFLTASRYEGMFAAFAVMVVLLFKKKYLTGILTPVFSFLPVLIIGLVSVAKGWYFFPNSVLLKSTAGGGDSWSFFGSFLNPQFFQLLWAYKRISVLLLISFIMFFALKKDKDIFSLRAMIIVFVIVTLLHINFAKLGSLLRYEMYIMVFGILLNSVLLIKFVKCSGKLAGNVIFLFVLISGIFFSISTYSAATDVPVASTNIYQMQYQMSRFINKYYSNGYIALNDIGAVNYYCDIYCTDMWGLANKEIADLRRSGMYNSDDMMRINKERKTEIAVVFETWFEKYGGMPKSWFNSGTWRIPDNITCGSDVITFYAPDSIFFHKLDDNLWDFNSELHGNVIRNGEFIIRHTGF